MVPCAPPAITHPPVLRPDWETLARLASTWSKPLDLDACPAPSSSFVGFLAQPTNHSLLGFEAQTKKPSWWFWGPNHQTVAVSFESQTGKPSTTGFQAKAGETIAIGFDVKLKNRPSGFEVKPLTNRPSGFEAKPLSNCRPWFWGWTKKPAQPVSLCMVQTTHGDTRPLDHPTTEYPTCATIPGPLH
jgi:hypothetical protein